jgi:hypothetical protein
MGLADRDYMKRTPEELDSLYRASSPPRVNLRGDAMVWMVVFFVVGIAARQLAVWLGIGLPFL